MWYSYFDPNWIKLTQGNSLELEFKMGSGAAESTALLTINRKNGHKVIQKTATVDLNGDVQFSISAAETKDLITGEYLYDVLYKNGDNVKTYVASIFQILPAVGKYTDIEPGPVPPPPPTPVYPDNMLVTRDGHYIRFRDGKVLVMKKESE